MLRKPFVADELMQTVQHILHDPARSFNRPALASRV
jgi:hypothetical protein